MVQRHSNGTEQCSSPPSHVCIVNSPFTLVDNDGILIVGINASNIVGQESTAFRLRLNDIGLSCIFSRAIYTEARSLLRQHGWLGVCLSHAGIVSKQLNLS